VIASLEDDWVGGPPFRLVLPRAKRDRLAECAARLRLRQRCAHPGCTLDGLPVVLVESELEAILCPEHQLVLLDGSVVEGQPMLATAAW
jgi:hypothetical protein